MAWFSNICNPQFSMIDGLVVTFIDNIQQTELTSNILKILVKLNEYIPELVFPQFFHNMQFPKALIQYMEQTEFANLSGDAFILLINIFDEDTTPEHISIDFIKKLMSALEYIEDEATLDSLISILVCLCPYFEKKSDDPDDISKNPILKEFVDKETLYREKLIRLTNRGTIYRLDKCCKTLNIILSKDEVASYYFNTNDLNLIMDILIRESLQNTQSKTRVQILKLMETVLDNPIYREYKYRFEDVE